MVGGRGTHPKLYLGVTEKLIFEGGKRESGVGNHTQGKGWGAVRTVRLAPEAEKTDN